MVIFSARHIELPSTVALPHLPAHPGEVSWRELSKGLWVGRSGDTHVGIIEQGRRFTLTDADDHAHTGFVTLDAAAQAATGPIDIIPMAAAGPSPVEEAAPPLSAGATVAGSAVCVAAFLGAVVGIVDLGFTLLLTH